MIRYIVTTCNLRASERVVKDSKILGNTQIPQKTLKAYILRVFLLF